MTEDNNQNTGSKLTGTIDRVVACCWCPEDERRVQITETFWVQPEFLPRKLSERYKHTTENLAISHGMCPDCEKKYLTEYDDNLATHSPSHPEGYKGR